MEMVKPPKSK